MNVKRDVLSLCCLLFSLIIPTVAFSVPDVINYQGMLTDDQGSRLDGVYAMRFYLYDALTGGTLLWEEEQSVVVSDGVYNVELGAVSSLTPEVFSSDQVYLEVEIYSDSSAGWEVFSPRQHLTSTAFAIKAERAYSLQGLGPDDFIQMKQEAGGDLSGAYPLPQVTGLRGRAISPVLPFKGNVLKYNGFAWAPAKDADSGGDITEVTAGSGLAGGATYGSASLYIPSGGVLGSHIHDGTITASDIADNSITAAKIDSSGLDADTLDGLDSTAFLFPSGDWGRSGVSSTLYEGATPLADKYVNETGDSMVGSADGAVLSVENSGAGNALEAEASGSGARSVYGNASNTGDVKNYGGYFESGGGFGAGVLGLATHGYGGKGVIGEAMGSAGIGVLGINHGHINAAIMAHSYNSEEGQAIWGIAEGTSSKAVIGQATNNGDYAQNYGGYFTSDGKRGIGVYGKATGGGKAGYFVGDVDVKGNINREYEDGTTHPAAPLAYAYIKSDGTVASGTPNVSSSRSATGIYEITINDESYFYLHYVTVVTPQVGPFMIGTTSGEGKLYVYIFSPSGTRTDAGFQFVTYKP